MKDVRTASAAELDAYAEQFNVPPREIVLDPNETYCVDIRTGAKVLTDDAFRQRIMRKIFSTF